MGRVAVIGIGQSMRGDDAAGLEAVRAWRTAFPATAANPDLTIENAEMPGLGLLDLLEGNQAAIIVDAVQSGSGPGTIHEATPDTLEAFAADSKSAHGWGAAETLRLGRKLDPSLEQIEVLVIGIEAEQFSIGNGLSPAVREALPHASAVIQQTVERLLER